MLARYIALLAVAGCAKNTNDGPRTVTLESFDFPPTVQISDESGPIAFQRKDNRTIEFTFRGSPGKVRLQFMTPCGPIAPKFGFGTEFRTAMIAESMDSTTIVVDNRGGQAKELRVGEAAWTITPGRRETFQIYGWSCGSRPIQIDGKQVGAADPRSFEGVLVDVQGTHCYEVVPHQFGQAASNEPRRERLPKSHVHVAMTLHAFAPPRTVKAMGPSSTVNILEDCE